ncbi:pyridoxal phosphate-dependent aminotransferase [Sporomusa acidovorans]|uniref:Aminotransferase n=1 Tax=Sporomusa acidovorans (strain ATCC 49682 / DSM 3132 / Mol) TaxID=1123286 RepID=A0ABZ3JA81_SPOA4|nr:aminotransferase class I/II-fold pyridoxal phosphate-dependent enzyme [Sporomusa acidovorans]OZC22915.1 methionine aminotransferase [Sporomusa acidovorans DSM 3132]SDE95369.1 aminotransferase [Sporomusa acidovorans]
MRKLSQITETFSESVIREMTRICDEVGGYNLSQGFPDFESPKAIQEAAIRNIRAGFNQYPVTFGEPELREAISRKVAQYNHIQCDPKTDITVTCGATEAMIATLKALINPGDEIIIFEPFYENYGPDSILSGATPRYVTLYGPDWHYSSTELAAAFNKKTKAIIINTPNNPTGKVFSKRELEEISGLCIKWDTYVVADEIYEHILYDCAEHISIASLPDMAARTVTINSISKTYSVTGWRVGWAIAAPTITQRIRKVHDFFTVGAPTPFQHAAAEAMTFDPGYYEGLKNHYGEARDFILEALREAGFQCEYPQGAYYVLADASAIMMRLGLTDDTAFSRKLIELTGVATVPGSSFYADKVKGNRQVRFCFCKKWETLKSVAQALTTRIPK